MGWAFMLAFPKLLRFSMRVWRRRVRALPHRAAALPTKQTITSRLRWLSAVAHSAFRVKSSRSANGAFGVSLGLGLRLKD